MNAFLAKIPAWLYLFLAALTIVALVSWCTTHGTRQPGELTKKERKATERTVQENVQAARRDSAAAVRLLDSANFYLARGRASADSARRYEKPTHPDTSLATLRRFLAKHH